MARKTASAPAPAPGIPATLDGLRERIDSLETYPGNPRRGDHGALRESLMTHGQYRPVVGNASTRQVLAGNNVFQVARELGWEELAVSWVDVDEDAARRIVLVDNRTNDLASYDDAALAELLQTLDDLGGTGYVDDDLERLLARLAPPDAFPDPEDGPVEEFQCPSCGYEWNGAPRLDAVGESG